MMTLSTVFASFIGGFVLDLSGASSLLLISSILAVIGAIIVFVIIDKIKVSAKSIYKS
jgi:PPP family 3-phenylpropionic acid transporter